VAAGNRAIFSALRIMAKHRALTARSAVGCERLVGDVKGPYLDLEARRVKNRNHVPVPIAHRISSDRHVNHNCGGMITYVVLWMTSFGLGHRL